MTKQEMRERYRAIRAAMSEAVEMAAPEAARVNRIVAMVVAWEPGTMEAPIAYVAGDVRMHEGVPYRCVQAHTHHGEPGWEPSPDSALWMQYHGTSEATARPWVAPTGAHDAYRAGEYMVWTDGQTYKCLGDTNYSPIDYAQAWEAV